MTLAAAFLWMAAAALVAVFIFLWKSLCEVFAEDHTQVLSYSTAEDPHGLLLEEKERVLKSIQELTFEREAGKLSDDDFEKIDGHLRQQAKEVLRNIDAYLAPHMEEARALVEEAKLKAKKEEAP